jgi:flavin reductase (DIM6/NTAB) family NADH-FMN oxidoreductase RutF
VGVVTACHKGICNGLTATAICAATTEPPTVIICVNRQARALTLIEASGAFAVNFLSDQQSNLARSFSTHGLAGEERLRLGKWTKLETGSPVLESSVSAIDCLLDRTLAYGTHKILFGRVVAVTNTERDALLYGDGFFRRVASE